jgi:membrane protein involved in colicin uptake
MTLRSNFLIVMSLVAAPVLGDSANAQQMQVQRCEAKDGTVTYSNRECPAGTKPVRTVNTSPPISVPDQQAAKDRAKKDAAEVKKLEKDLKKVAEEEKRAAEKREKAEATIVDRCERARRELARAIEARNKVDTRAATIEQMQKASQEVSKREAELPKACPT